MQNMIGGSTLLGANGHGTRRQPSLATNLAFMNGTEMAAPYLKHIAFASPEIANSAPEMMLGLLEPSVASPKPPAARAAPTTTMEFRASKTLKANDCSGCGLVNGTVLVTNLGVVPPRTYMCYPVNIGGDCETLVPYDTIDYDKDASKYFTLAANASYAISLRTISRPVDGVLNGTATAAHVMDIDDICTYSQGAYDQAATTNCDNLTGVPLSEGTIGIMGPESYTTDLQAPYHCGAKSYPGWSYSVLSSKTVSNTGDPPDMTVNFSELTSHRFFADTTFEVTAILTLEAPPTQTDNVWLYLSVIKGRCPPSVEKCDQNMLGKWAEANVDWILIGTTSISPMCKKDTETSAEHKERVIERMEKAKEARRKKKEERTKMKCSKKRKCDDEEEVCDVDPSDEECPEPQTYRDTCCKPKKNKLTGKPPVGSETFTQYAVSGRYTTCALENAVSLVVISGPCTKIKCVRFEIKTFSGTRVNQFGPAIIQRLDDITKDIVVQLNIKAVIAGIQTGMARSIAQPSPPSRLALGDEEAVITQALFDDPTSGICRMYTGPSFAQAAAKASMATKADAIGLMQAAPLGDTIRTIANTISGIGNQLGGPFSTIGNVIGTVGNVAGGIGDAISKIFSAPRGTIMAAPLLSAPKSGPSLYQAGGVQGPRPYTPDPDLQTVTPSEVEASVKANYPFPTALSRLIMRPGGTGGYDTYQSFPWVDPGAGVAGIARVYLTSQPMALPDRIPTYNSWVAGPFVYHVDERLTRSNNAEFILEAVLALALTKRSSVFLTTDASADIFGDSFAAAVLAAATQPAPNAAVTGGLTYTRSSGLVRLKPVGLTSAKTQAALDAGLILLAPNETDSIYLRNNSSGTEAAHASDVELGYLEQTPQLILIDNLSDLINMLTFVKSTQTIPIGPEEEAIKEETVAPGRAQQAKLKDYADRYGTKDKTQDEINDIRSTEFILNLPGFDDQSVKLLDPAFYEDYRATITNAPPDGMGIKWDRLMRKIELGDVDYLRGVSSSFISRALSAAKKAAGGTKRKRGGAGPRGIGRQPAFKRATNTSQMAALLERLRNQMDTEASTSGEPASGTQQAKRPKNV